MLPDITLICQNINANLLHYEYLSGIRRESTVQSEFVILKRHSNHIHSLRFSININVIQYFLCCIPHLPAGCWTSDWYGRRCLILLAGGRVIWLNFWAAAAAAAAAAAKAPHNNQKEILINDFILLICFFLLSLLETNWSVKRKLL